MLTKSDLAAIGKVFDQKLDQKFDDKLGKFGSKLEKKFDQKLKPIYEFIEFAKPALIALLDESQATFKQHLPERVKHLEDIHPQLHHHAS